MIVVCASESPRSAIISTRSRKLGLYRRYQRTQSTMKFPVEMAAFEKIVNVQHAWPGSSRANLPPNMHFTPALRTRTLATTLYHRRTALYV